MASAASGALTKHGFPRGYLFVPAHLEIVQLLADRLRGRPLPQPIAGIFHDIRILDHHPQELYEQYKEYQEAGCIYFFSRQEFPSSDARNGRAPGDGKKRRPQRAAYGGGWKPSGGGKQLKRPWNKGGGVVGKMITMVFYDRRRVGAVEKQFKTDWGLHEFTVLVGPNKFSDLAVYRLYKVKNGAAKGGKQQQANGAHHHHVPAAAAAVAVADHHAPSTSAAAALPSYAAGTSSAISTSQEQKQLISIEQIQHHHNQHAAMPGQRSIWAPPPAAINPPVQQDDTKPGYFKFVSPSLPETVPPAAVNPGEQRSPTTDHSGVTRSPPASPVAPAMSQFAAGRDETMEEAPSQLEVVPPEQLLLPAQDEDYNMGALFNEGSDVPVDGGIVLDPFDDFLLFDGGDIAFSMEELIGTDSNNPSSGDGRNNQADGKLQF